MPYCFSQRLCHFTFSPRVPKGFDFSSSFPKLFKKNIDDLQLTIVFCHDKSIVSGKYQVKCIKYLPNLPNNIA